MLPQDFRHLIWFIECKSCSIQLRICSRQSVSESNLVSWVATLYGSLNDYFYAVSNKVDFNIHLVTIGAPLPVLGLSFLCSLQNWRQSKFSPWIILWRIFMMLPKTASQEEVQEIKTPFRDVFRKTSSYSFCTISALKWNSLEASR